MSVATLDKDKKTIEELLSNQTKEFRKVVVNYIKDLKSEESYNTIRNFLDQGRTDLVLEYINDQSSLFTNALLLVFLSGATLETALLRPYVHSIPRLKTVALDFDIKAGNSLNILSQLQNQLVTNFSNANTAAYEYLLSEMSGRRLNSDQAARFLINHLGLNRKQIVAIENYRLLLENGSRQALERKLRNPRYDDLVTTAIDRDKPLTAIQIDNMVNSYRQRMLQFRIDALSHDQAKSAVEAGRDAAAFQILAMIPFQDLIEYEMVKEWRSMRDDDVRATHKHGALDGQVVNQNDWFKSPSGARLKYPRDWTAPLSETANCRCNLLRYIRKKPMNITY